jgi:hypothetical protein
MWRGEICFSMSNTSKTDISTTALRTHIDRPGDDRCSVSSLQSKPRRFSPLMHSYMITSIRADTKCSHYLPRDPV